MGTRRRWDSDPHYPPGHPAREERNGHHLWGSRPDLPPAGRFVIYDRNRYGRVLLERIEGIATAAQWQRAHDGISDFEDQLVERGALTDHASLYRRLRCVTAFDAQPAQ